MRLIQREGDMRLQEEHSRDVPRYVRPVQLGWWKPTHEPATSSRAPMQRARQDQVFPRIQSEPGNTLCECLLHGANVPYS